MSKRIHNSIRDFAKSCDCTGCMVCIDTCHQDAINYTIDKNGFYRIWVNNALCIGCSACRQTCPGINKNIYNESVLAKAFAAWNNDELQRKNSASGGVFAALATYIINQRGVVYGAAIDGFNVRHIRIDQLNDLCLLQNSKYQHSATVGIYRQVKADLKNGKLVLFSGLGCQIAALYAYLRNQQYDNLFTIDTICGGLSSMLPMLTLARSKKYESIISFRDKSNGWKSKGFTYRLKMMGTNGVEKDLGNENLVLKCFSAKITKRSSCLNCRFVGFKRQSDCTIGDFWGDTNFIQQHSRGLSSIIVHSQRMLQLLCKVNISMCEVTIENIAQNNPNIYFGKFKGVRYLFSRHLALFFLRIGLHRCALPLIDYNSLFSIEMRFFGSYMQKKIDAALFESLKTLNK